MAQRDITDERAETCAGAVSFKTEIREDTIGDQKRFRRVVTSQAAVAAPGPRRGGVAESCPDGIEREITRKLDEVPVALDEDRMEPPLKEMTIEAVTPVEPLRVGAVQALEAAREVGVARFQDEMVVIRHQAIAVTKPTELVRYVSEHREESTAVEVLEEDQLASVTSRSDVIQTVGELDARRPRHAPRLNREAPREGRFFRSRRKEPLLL